MTHSSTSDSSANHTPKAVKDAVLELLKYGVVEAARKVNVYRILLSAREQAERILEPLGLVAIADDTRGIIFVCVADAGGENDGDSDEWLHPLVRRIRLTLEQSLVVAILRQQFIGREMQSAVGVEVSATLDDILPSLQLFLGNLGSEQYEDKRLRTLLEQLRTHGIVSDIDENGRFVIRPLIVHLANPDNLATLIVSMKRAAALSLDSSSKVKDDTRHE